MEPGVSTVERRDQGRCVPNVDYVKSLPGILKIVQTVTSIIAFALSMSVPWGALGGGWVNFVSINGFIQAVIWGVLHLFGVVPPIMANYFVELIIYAIFTLFFFIAGIVAACNGFLPAVGAAAFFCFVCMIAFGVDAFFQFLDVRSQYKARNDRRPTSESSNNPNAEDTLFVRPGNEKVFY